MIELFHERIAERAADIFALTEKPDKVSKCCRTSRRLERGAPRREGKEPVKKAKAEKNAKTSRRNLMAAISAAHHRARPLINALGSAVGKPRPGCWRGITVRLRLPGRHEGGQCQRRTGKPGRRRRVVAEPFTISSTSRTM